MNEERKKLHENIYGKPGFLIPLEVLPGKHFNIVGDPGSFHTMKIKGYVVEIEGKKYLEVSSWEC